MSHIQALLIKTAMAGIVLLVVLTGIYNYPAGATIGLAVLIVILSYIVGDLAILQATNNTIATLSDLVLATLIIWIVGPFFQGAFIPFSVALISAIIISAGEWIFHKFFIRSTEDELETQS
ncbi:MAG: YndM family protein [Bacillaceae bacterium]|nr:YndM family protein [Bacillaceae bacterium]